MFSRYCLRPPSSARIGTSQASERLRSPKERAVGHIAPEPGQGGIRQPGVGTRFLIRVERFGVEFVTKLERKYISKFLQQAVTSAAREHQEWG